MKLFLLLAAIAVANQTEQREPPVEIIGKQYVTLPTSTGTKTIALPTIKFSSGLDWPKKVKWEEQDFRNGIRPFSALSGAVDLGMNSVPVLNQGEDGTCVTFASIAALDALFGRRDFISPQCSLELFLGLGVDYWQSGYYAGNIIELLKKYGVVPRGKCNNPYPTRHYPVDKNTYKAHTDPTIPMQNVTDIQFDYLTIDQIKPILDKGHRLVINFGLLDNKNDPISYVGFNLVINGAKNLGGLWACEQPGSKNYCQGIPTMGHAAVLMGYDDSQRLLKIRNSWCMHYGDQGDFYMTYKFFEALNHANTEIYLNLTEPLRQMNNSYETVQYPDGTCSGARNSDIWLPAIFLIALSA